MSKSEEEIKHTELQEMNITVYYKYKPSLQDFPDLISKKILHPSVLRRALFIEEPLHHAYYLHLGRQIIEAIEREGGVDLIHGHFVTPNRFAVTYAAAYYNIPCTVTAHAHEIFSPPNLRRLKQVCSRFDHMIVPSEYNKQYLRKEIGIDTDMSVVPATTDVKKFEPSEGCISGRLLTIGRLVEKKGYKYSIDAVANLIKRGYDVEYHIIGTGEQKDSLIDRVKQKGIEEHVEFLGHVPDDKLQEELHEAELFILPCIIASNGDRDVAPVALKEAMATKTACISTTISAIPELITDGHDGLLVKPNNTPALTNAITELLDNPDRRQELAANGRKTVQTQFDISNSVDDLVKVFSSIRK